MPYKYLASPYSHVDFNVMQRRFEATERALAWLLKRKIWAYSPIVQCHVLAQRYALPTDAAYWRQYNEAMMRGSEGILVLLLGGWRDSAGVAAEIRYARAQDRSVQYLYPTERDDYHFSTESKDAPKVNA